MPDLPWLPLIARWLHILSAALAIGVPIYVRYVLQNAAATTLDDTTHTRLRDAIGRYWRPILYLVILLFLVTGFYNYIFVTIPQVREMPRDIRSLYHPLIGFKMLLAFWAFFVASALAGKSAALAFIRKNSRTWLTILILTVLVVLMMSNVLRAMRDLGMQAGIDTRLTPPATLPG